MKPTCNVRGDGKPLGLAKSLVAAELLKRAALSCTRLGESGGDEEGGQDGSTYLEMCRTIFHHSTRS